MFLNCVTQQMEKISFPRHQRFSLFRKPNSSIADDKIKNSISLCDIRLPCAALLNSKWRSPSYESLSSRTWSSIRSKLARSLKMIHKNKRITGIKTSEKSNVIKNSRGTIKFTIHERRERKVMKFYKFLLGRLFIGLEKY